MLFFIEKVSDSVWGHPETITFEVMIRKKGLATSNTSLIRARTKYHSVESNSLNYRNLFYSLTRNTGFTKVIHAFQIR